MHGKLFFPMESPHKYPIGTFKYFICNWRSASTQESRAGGKYPLPQLIDAASSSPVPVLTLQGYQMSLCFQQCCLTFPSFCSREEQGVSDPFQGMSGAPTIVPAGQTLISMEDKQDKSGQALINNTPFAFQDCTITTFVRGCEH